MNINSNHIIGDIFEVNRDINEKARESKSIIDKIKVKHYRKRLYKLVKSFKKKNYKLDKFNIQELLTYISAQYDGKYKSIQKAIITNAIDDVLISSKIVIPSDDEKVNNITYDIDIYNNKPVMDIKCVISYITGESHLIGHKLPSLYYEDSELDMQSIKIIKYLNNELLDILESYLLETIEKYKVKGYIKEVKA